MGYTVIEDTILYEDKDLLVCHKPAACRCRADRLEVRIWSMPCSDIWREKKSRCILR